MAKILPYRDTLEKRMLRTINNLTESTLDCAALYSYCFQREIGCSRDGLEKVYFMNWSPSQFESAEGFYQLEVKAKERDNAKGIY